MALKIRIEVVFSMCKLVFLSFFFISLGLHGQTFVKENGRLQVVGHQLCNRAGRPVQLKGFSTHGVMHYPGCITRDAVFSIRDFWGGTVVRLAIYVSDNNNKLNYNESPEFNKQYVDSVVQWTEEAGIYCIIDWHVMNPGNPNDPVYSGATDFFSQVAKKYKKKQHVMYEICNEPNGDEVTWDIIARYANMIMPAIRKQSPKAIVIIGTPHWSQYIEEVQPSLLKDTRNVMYAFHFYAGVHNSLYSSFVREIHRIPIFSTEWAACTNSGSGSNNKIVADKFLMTMEKHVDDSDTVMVSWCNFSFSDKNESASAIKPFSCEKCTWNDYSVTGEYIHYWLNRKPRGQK